MKRKTKLTVHDNLSILTFFLQFQVYYCLNLLQFRLIFRIVSYNTILTLFLAIFFQIYIS